MSRLAMRRSLRRASSALALTVSAAASVHAQLPSASTGALGMADNFTAVARGYAAVSWNPAMLGMAGNPGASLALLPVRGIAGLDPVSLKDLDSYEGRFVPDAVREQWLQNIEREGNEQGTGGGDATFIAAQIGRLGVQLGSTLRVVGNLSPGAAELLLFGNAGRTGEPRAFNLQGSNIKSHAVSTLAMSYGLPIARSATGQTALGITAKYTVGHVLLMGEDQGSTITADPSLDVKFPVVGTSTDDFDANSGHGFGLDVGVATRRGPLTVAATVRNIINTFEWDESKLRFRQGLAQFDGTDNTSDFDEKDFAQAPADLRQLVADAKFQPVISAGAAYEASTRITLSADFRTRAGETTIEDEPKLHAGVGAELRFIPLLPVRIGAAAITDGYQVGGGLGLNLGPLNLAASVVSRNTGLGGDLLTMFTLISTIGR